MYTLLIVDDEPLIREGLAGNIDWQALGFTVCGTAADGEEAYALVSSCAPDVLITDISMAGMNGIALLRKLRENGYTLPVVIVSGYDDFEYARQAIRYGAVDYLLKPLNEDSLRSLFASLKRTLDLCGQGSLRQTGSTSAAVRASMPKNALLSFLQGRGETAETVCSLMLPYGFQMSHLCAMAILSADQETLSMVETHASRHSWSCAASDAAASPFMLPVQDGLAMLFPWADAALEHCLTDLFYQIQSEAPEAKAYCLLERGDFEKMPAIYRHMTADSFRFYYLTPWTVSPPPELPSGVELCMPTQETLCTMILSGNLDGLREQLVSTSLQMQQCRPNPDAAAIRFAEFYARTAALLQESCGTLPALSFYDLYKQLCDCHNAADFLENFQTQMMELANAALAMIASRPDVIRESQRYIETHYQEDISLSMLAKRFYLNASYLSALFSRKTGGTISDYLEKIRLQKAAELLCTTRMNVSEVGKSVGYQSARYFCRLFKERYRCTPTEYRLQSLREVTP